MIATSYEMVQNCGTFLLPSYPSYTLPLRQIVRRPNWTLFRASIDCFDKNVDETVRSSVNGRLAP